MNFLFSWVLMIFQSQFKKKFKESIFLQFNFIWDDSLFFQIFLWISISFCFQIMIFFPFWILIVLFFSFFKTSSFSLFGSWSFFVFTFGKIMILFPFRILIVFLFHLSKDYDPLPILDLDCFLFFVFFFFTFQIFGVYVLFSFSFFLWSSKYDEKFLGSKFYSHFVWDLTSKIFRCWKTCILFKYICRVMWLRKIIKSNIYLDG